MAEKMELCGRCAALMADTKDLHKVSGGVDNKVTCAKCGRRRYGGTYELVPKRRKPFQKEGGDGKVKPTYKSKGAGA